MNSKQRRSGMPKTQKVYDYWRLNYERLGSLENGEHRQPQYITECFACGNIAHLHRAHILPLIQGGSNDLQNLHLLCPGCHNESENCVNYWTWLAYKRKNEWQYPDVWAMKYLEKNGIDVEKEITYLRSSIMTWEEIDDYLGELFRKTRRQCE